MKLNYNDQRINEYVLINLKKFSNKICVNHIKMNNIYSKNCAGIFTLNDWHFLVQFETECAHGFPSNNKLATAFWMFCLLLLTGIARTTPFLKGRLWFKSSKKPSPRFVELSERKQPEQAVVPSFNFLVLFGFCIMRKRPNGRRLELYDMIE